MTDDRQERYAAAAYESVNPGFRWVDAIPSDKDAFREDVAGVMAVADAELQQERERLFAPLHRAESENARLRAELTTERNKAYDLAAAITRVRAAAQKAQDSANAWDLDDLIRDALGGVRCVGCGETNGPNCADGSCCRG